MVRFSFAILSVALLFRSSFVKGEIGSTLDPSSYSNVDQFQPLHLSFDLEIDFDTSSVVGTVTHTMVVMDSSESTVYLDVWDGLEVYTAEFMTVNATTDCPANFTAVTFEVTTPNANIGNALSVVLPCTMESGTDFLLKFTYATHGGNYAIDWLTPEQTAGKKLPYMYSLCELNFCRDLAPMMDTPSMKITYDATVVAPKEFVVKMSANETSVGEFNSTHKVYQFVASIKIPSYLIAIVVGDLETRFLSDRVSVVSEPSVVDAAAEEFVELPTILDIAEAYLTPYIWGNYSIVIMPPSFPWGGMEHPLVTFASPALITGDKSMVKVAIHEMTHSWFGNDVGCESWGNMWLNEGLNTFMERKTLALLRGQDFALIDYYIGNTTMYADMLDYGLNDSYSSLFPQIGDDDPENSFSDIPYDKGSQFAYYIETILGEDMMQMMLQTYINTFSQQAINYTDFQAMYEGFVYANFDNATAQTIIIDTDWKTWVTVPGLPPVTLNFSTAESIDAEVLANAYLSLGDSPVNYTGYFDYFSAQKVVFVGVLAASPETTAELLALIDADLNITKTLHPQVKADWFILGIELGYDAVLEPAHQWMSEIGRVAYVRPTYRALVESGMCNTAQQWYNENKDFYNSYVVGKVETELAACPGEGGSGSSMGYETFAGVVGLLSYQVLIVIAAFFL